MTIDAKYYPTLSKVFSSLVLNSIAFNGYSPYLTEIWNSGIIKDLTDKNQNLSEFLSSVYNYLLKRYRNEYIYKNVIANEIILGRHSFGKSKMLSELRVGNCKADVVILNGSLTVYEIKSEYDTLNRLERQINTYSKVFEYVNVITTQKNLSRINLMIPNFVGVLMLTDKFKISTIINPRSNLDNIELEVVFDSLRKREYLKIIKDFYGEIPAVPNTLEYKVCKELYRQIPLDKAIEQTLRVLKLRNDCLKLENFLESAPNALSAYALKNANNNYLLNSLKMRLDLSMSEITKRS